ncbi:MAG: sugar ABC transporter substrate-binding protein [Eubacteriales bacterium]|nr:sugar ABC transporter substrate-binding protein [Eubacteriales bacterium]
MKKFLALALAFVLVFSLCITAYADEAPEEITFGYISPGPDTWYLRAAEGFEWACGKLGVKCITVNSNRDSNTELSNIEYLRDAGVAGIGSLSFNESGVMTCGQLCEEAGIGCAIIDASGALIKNGQNHTVSVDFDWADMGVTYAEWMAETYPGENYVIITGTFDSVACQVLDEAMNAKAEELGKNKCVDIRAGEYNPNVAADVAEDLANADLDFSIIFVMNEDMAAAVITRLEDIGVADKYHVIAQNGSPVGIQFMEMGSLEFTTASSPGLEAAIAAFAMYDSLYRTGETNQLLMCPYVPVSAENANDPFTVVPWEVNEEVFTKLIVDYFPDFEAYLK